MTLPEPSQIDDNGISRYRRGMPDSSHIPVAAEAFERLEGVAGAALADPVLADRRREALERDGALVAGRRLVVGARQAHRQRRRGLGLDAEVGEHVGHERLVDQPLAERAAVGGMPGPRWQRPSASRRRCR